MNNDQIKNIILKSPHIERLTDLVIGQTYQYKESSIIFNCILTNFGYLEEEGADALIHKYFYVELTSEKYGKISPSFALDEKGKYYYYSGMWNLMPPDSYMMVKD